MQAPFKKRPYGMRANHDQFQAASEKQIATMTEEAGQRQESSFLFAHVMQNKKHHKGFYESAQQEENSGTVVSTVLPMLRL